jgi:hypothetical protein
MAHKGFLNVDLVRRHNVVRKNKVEGKYKCQKGIQHIDDLKTHFGIHNF